MLLVRSVIVVVVVFFFIVAEKTEIDAMRSNIHIPMPGYKGLVCWFEKIIQLQFTIMNSVLDVFVMFNRFNRVVYVHIHY